MYDLRASYAVKDVAARYGGKAVMNRVGHAFFKGRMRELNAVFAEKLPDIIIFGKTSTATTGHTRAANPGAHVQEAAITEAAPVPLRAKYSSQARSTRRWRPWRR